MTESTHAEEPEPHILAVDDDEDIRQLVATYLSLEGFRVSVAANGSEAVEKTLALRPDLVLMDVMMPGVSGTEALAILRSDFRTQFTPVVLLTAKSLVADKVEHLASGADDYIVKPFDPDELVARVRVVLRRSRALRGLNPLTGLPGNIVIDDEIQKRLDADQAFACLYIDLTKFKELNDFYGFSRGDDVIRALGQMLMDILVANPTPGKFVGHVGGDDFIVLCHPDESQAVAQDVVERFDKSVPTFYDAEDRERGWIEILDRQGEKKRFGFVTVAVGIVLSSHHEYVSSAEVSHNAATMKQVAKREPGSAWVVDRRQE